LQESFLLYWNILIQLLLLAGTVFVFNSGVTATYQIFRHVYLSLRESLPNRTHSGHIQDPFSIMAISCLNTWK
jgi:hypothetical protein